MASRSARAPLEHRRKLGLEGLLALAGVTQLAERVFVPLVQLGRPLHADRERLLRIGDARRPGVAVERVRPLSMPDRYQRRIAQHGADEGRRPACRP